jgi:hypothetical protein
MIDEIACSAAEGGYKDIVDAMIELGSKDFDGIAQAAADGGHKTIVDAMIERGAKVFNDKPSEGEHEDMAD